MTAKDTIFALSSGAGRAGIAVVRVSGPHAHVAIEALTGAPVPAPRRTVYRRLYRASQNLPLDRGLVVFFAAPHSATGQDVAEFHVHGSRAVLVALFAALRELGLRPAEAGEFSRRGFENGKYDLTEIEGLADLVAAETEGQRRQALSQMEGALGRLYENWRHALIDALALVEGTIDFPDEDIPASVICRAQRSLDEVRQAISDHLMDGHRGERLRDGVMAVILGAPNVGKSSLLNALAQRDVAIVSEVSGTTRDVIEVRLDLAGIPVILADTAGLRDSGDAVEGEGIRRALARAETADLRILVRDIRDSCTGAGLQPRPGDIQVANKADLLPGAAMGRIGNTDSFAVSAKVGSGISSLIERLTERVRDDFGLQESPMLTRERHRHALEACLEALSRCCTQSNELSLWAEDIRLAARYLGRVTGRVDVEDILNVIFSEFCIGK